MRVSRILGALTAGHFLAAYPEVARGVREFDTEDSESYSSSSLPVKKQAWYRRSTSVLLKPDCTDFLTGSLNQTLLFIGCFVNSSHSLFCPLP